MFNQPNVSRRTENEDHMLINREGRDWRDGFLSKHKDLNSDTTSSHN